MWNGHSSSRHLASSLLGIDILSRPLRSCSRTMKTLKWDETSLLLIIDVLSRSLRKKKKKERNRIYIEVKTQYKDLQSNVSSTLHLMWVETLCIRFTGRSEGQRRGSIQSVETNINNHNRLPRVTNIPTSFFVHPLGEKNSLSDMNIYSFDGLMMENPGKSRDSSASASYSRLMPR
jgi:hypothetical protein